MVLRRDRHMAEAVGTMAEYRAYSIDTNDRILSRYDLVCADDDDAKERARQGPPIGNSEPLPRSATFNKKGLTSI